MYIADMMGVDTLPQLTREDNLKLYEFLTGSEPNAQQDARDKMITGNVRLVLWKVRTYLARYFWLTHLEDDMVSAGFEGLIRAVDDMRSQPVVRDPNPVGLISIGIQREISKVAEESHLVSVPAQTIRDRKGATSPLNLPKTYAPEFEAGLGHESDHAPSSVDIQEILLSCAEIHEEREILRLRTEGYTDAEISAELDLPLTTIFMLRREMYRCFQEKYEAP